MKRSFALARYLTNGDPDPMFGSGGAGIVTTDFPTHDEATPLALAIQPDGKIVAGGFVRVTPGTTDTNVAMARYLGDGSLDPDFGAGGLVTIAGDADAAGIAVQADGGILVAAKRLLRLTTTGVLDATFAAGGGAPLPAEVGYPRGIVLYDGKILVLGNDSLTRFDASGAIDTTFGRAGVVTPYVANHASLAVTADGHILVGGIVFRGVLSSWAAVVRYTAEGLLDTTFGPGGALPILSQGLPESLAVQSDGRILLCGYAMRTADASVTFDASLVRWAP